MIKGDHMFLTLTIHHSDIVPGEADNIRYYYMMVKNAFEVVLQTLKLLA